MKKTGCILMAAVLMALILACRGAGKILKSSFTETTAGVPDSGTKKRLVVLDAGHGGMDCGKVGANGIEEKEVNLKITKLTEKFLTQDGIDVVLTRTDDERLADSQVEDLEKRVEIMNESEAALVVSIHQNSYSDPSVSGAQVFYCMGSEEGEAAAGLLQEMLNEMNPEHQKEIKANDTYYILKNTRVPVVIVECGFLSNYEEAEKLAGEEYQTIVAEVVADGVVSYIESGEELFSR